MYENKTSPCLHLLKRDLCFSFHIDNSGSLFLLLSRNNYQRWKYLCRLAWTDFLSSVHDNILIRQFTVVVTSFSINHFLKAFLLSLITLLQLLSEGINLNRQEFIHLNFWVLKIYRKSRKQYAVDEILMVTLFLTQVISD